MAFFIQMREERLNPVRVIYTRRIGAYGKENAVLMQRWKEWLREHGLFGSDSVILAIAMDDPAITEASQCRYDVCMVAGESVKVSGNEVYSRELSGGNYVVFLIEHTSQAVERAWSKSFGYLGQMGYTLDLTRPIMERYAKRLVDWHLCELCVPVKERE